MKDTHNKKFWERVSPLYAKFMRNNSAVYQKTCAVISDYLNPDMKILELACGTGQFTRLLCDKTNEWIATDFSPKMIENAKKTNADLHAAFKVEDATNIEFGDETFDGILVANALHVMPEPKKAMTEMQRTLKPGGLLFGPTFVYDNKTPKTRMWMLERMGFKTYNKWSTTQYSDFVQSFGFETELMEIIEAKPLCECLIIARKK